MVTSAEVRTASHSRGHPSGGGDPVLMSKIIVPSLPAWAVSRPRIESLIAAGVRGPLTTVTGPPGAGKTMAITLWAAARTEPGPVVWITLDEYDNRPRVFWPYVVAALRQAGIAVPRVSSAGARGTAVDHAFLLRLAAVLAAQDPPVVMVIDDIHLLTDADTLDGLAYVLWNAKPGLRLVASSRMDPLLPLHRYRLNGELTDIRADDLAFSVTESGTLMAQHGLTLSEAALESLTGRTEGWAAGLRLAAISLEGHPDPEQFVKEFDAENGAITSYLVDEVLNAQPAPIRDFLLRTSILHRVSADIGRELGDDEQAPDVLPALAETNAFVRPLGHGWYRYHPLFAAVLRLKLRRECPGRLPDLHRRAARWCRQRGWLADAVRHAGESGDWQLAARIAVDELAIGQLIEPQGNQLLADEFRRMSRDQAGTEPQSLLVAAAMELADAGSDSGMASLEAAENILDDLPADDDVPARLAAAQIRLTISRRSGDLEAATAAAARAEALLEQIPEDLLARHPGIRARVLAGRGAVHLWAGQLDRAADKFKAGLAAADADADAEAADSSYERADCLGYFALVEALHGRLSHAAELAGEAAKTAENPHDGIAEPTLAASIALAYVHLERNEVQQSDVQLVLAGAALRARPDKLMSAVASLVAARRQLAEGRAGAASELVSRARQDWSPPGWLEHRLTLLEARASALAGDITSAVDAAARAAQQSKAEAAVAAAHAWLAADDAPAARAAMATVTTAAGEPCEQVSLEGWLVHARLCYSSGDPVRGRRSLEHAMRLGKQEQVRLPFAMERTWIRPLLRRDPDLAQAYPHLLEPGMVRPRLAASSRPDAAGEPTPLVVERLSEREREVIQHLAGMLSTAEIASEMYISVNTVKTHLRSIYRKLSAAHRGEAVRRARQLELI
jgi:LuxR family transcriptional regulator, maltose regulon positive regulatory protein